MEVYLLLQSFLTAFALIFIAEMGDKTQFLALAFGSKYKMSSVITGIAIGSAANHGLAIVLGSLLTKFIPISIIQIFAAFLFIFFGLWSLKFEADEDEENETKGNYGPVVTVALAFFIGELGDKTQLTAMTLGATGQYPLFTLLGTVTGMIVVGGIGIIVGKLLGKKIPEATMKMLASVIFIFFGSLGLYNSLKASGYGYAINPINIVAYLGIITLLILLVFRYNAISRDKHYQEKLGQVLAQCKGCGKCSEGSCSINKAREELEVQYFGENIPYVGDIIKYIESINKKDINSGLKIAETYRKNKG